MASDVDDVTADVSHRAAFEQSLFDPAERVLDVCIVHETQP